jgi:hypothetical protein
MQDYLNDYYGYLCTCQKDKEQISEMLGATGQSMKTFGACGEGDDVEVQAG